MPVLLAPLLIPLTAALTWLLLYMLRQSWGTIIRAISDSLRSKGFLKTVAFLGPSLIEKLIHHGEKRVADEAIAGAPSASGFMSHLAASLEYQAFTLAYLAESTLASLRGLHGAAIPKAINGRVNAIRRRLHALAGTTVWLLRHVLPALHVNRVEAEAAKRAATLAAQDAALAKSTAVALPGTQAIPGTRTRVKDISETLWRSTTKRLSRLEKLIAGGVITGVIVSVVTRRLPWFRCSNVDKAARGLCRMDRGLLDSLLADSLILAGTISIVELARECQGFVGLTEDAIRAFVREAHDVSG